MQAIIAATALGGHIMLMSDELGQVKPGFLADLILVDGDPLADISVLQQKDKLLAIMKGGRFHKDPGTGKQDRPADITAGKHMSGAGVGLDP